MASRLADVENGEKGGGLAGGGQDSAHPALQIGDAGGYGVVGGVLQPGVEVAVGL